MVCTSFEEHQWLRIALIFKAKTDPERDINILLDIPVKGRISKRIKNTATVEELLEQVRLDVLDSQSFVIVWLSLLFVPFIKFIATILQLTGEQGTEDVQNFGEFRTYIWRKRVGVGHATSLLQRQRLLSPRYQGECERTFV